MEELQKLLPKYKLKLYNSIGQQEYVFIKYKNYRSGKIIKNIYDQILIYKFIHNNIKYIIDLILLNGYIEDKTFCFIKGNLSIYIEYNYLNLVDYTIYGNTNYNKILSDPNTLMDELREFLGIDITYKPVIVKNE